MPKMKKYEGNVERLLAAAIIYRHNLLHDESGRLETYISGSGQTPARECNSSTPYEVPICEQCRSQGMSPP
jgi:hypothetical protein